MIVTTNDIKNQTGKLGREGVIFAWRNDMVLTTNDIAQLPLLPKLTKNQIRKLCREGEIFAWKEPNKSYFSAWQIPPESFALYLKYNFNTIKLMESDEPMNNPVRIIKNTIRRMRPANDELYSLYDLSNIFGLPVNQINTMFPPEIIRDSIARRIIATWSIPSVSTLRVLRYLKENPERLTSLQERHTMLLSEGPSETENKLRHLLMLYAYYENHKYLLR